MKLTPEQEKEYVAGGGSRCPFCGSGSIEGTGHRDFGADWATNEIACPACGEVWEDVYTLTGIDRKEHP